MPAGTAVKAAIEELRNALGALDRAIDRRFERERDSVEMEQEIRRVHADRSRLAQDLDQSEFRANRLEEVSFSESDAAIDKERVVFRPRAYGDRLTGGVGEIIARANDKVFK